MAFILRRPESRRDCPKVAGGVSPRYSAVAGKAPAGGGRNGESYLRPATIACGTPVGGGKPVLPRLAQMDLPDRFDPDGGIQLRRRHDGKVREFGA